MIVAPPELPPFSSMRGEMPAPPATKLDAASTVAFGFCASTAIEAERGAVLLTEGMAGRDLIQHFNTLSANVDQNDRTVDQGVEVWVSVDDPGTPVVRVKLSDLLDFGARPVNLAVNDGARVMLKLYVPEAEWPKPAILLTVELR